MRYLIDSQAEFDRYKAATFAAGDEILFKAGESFYGQFAPSGNGSEGAPIRVSTYLSAATQGEPHQGGRRSAIHGLGKVDAPFKLHNSSFWEIENLELTNTDGTDGDQGNVFGIRIIGEDAGLLRHIVIRNCYVHHVNGMVGGKPRGGIHVDVVGEKRRTWFEDVTIEGNTVSDVGGVGISTSSTWGSILSDEWTPWRGVAVRGNRIERTGRNGIIVRVSERPLIERNILAYNSRADVGHSVFTFDTRGAVIQYNEAYGNTGAPTDQDRGGFDADFKCEDTVIQYNYSHDNHWFCGIMRKYNKNVVIRYNISRNDRLGAYYYGFPQENDLHGVLVHDNLHFFDSGGEAVIFVRGDRDRTPVGTNFKGNVFVFAERGDWGMEPDATCDFEGNAFYNVRPAGRDAISDTAGVMRRIGEIASKLVSAGIPLPEPSRDRLDAHRTSIGA